jgi:hypothetical protein
VGFIQTFAIIIENAVNQNYFNSMPGYNNNNYNKGSLGMEELVPL